MSALPPGSEAVQITGRLPAGTLETPLRSLRTALFTFMVLSKSS